MKKIIMGIVAVLLLGGGAGGGYMFLKKPAEAALPDDEHAAPKEDKHAKKKGGHGEEVAEFVQLAPLILPILDKSGLLQTVSVVVALEVKNKADAEFVKSLQPRITDAFIQEMYGVIHHPAGMVNGNVIKVGVLKKRLNKVGQRVLGEDVLQDVLLQVVQQRPI
jgi:flagellar FliL protein